MQRVTVNLMRRKQIGVLCGHEHRSQGHRFVQDFYRRLQTCASSYLPQVLNGLLVNAVAKCRSALIMESALNITVGLLRADSGRSLVQLVENVLIYIRDTVDNTQEVFLIRDKPVFIYNLYTLYTSPNLAMSVHKIYCILYSMLVDLGNTIVRSLFSCAYFFQFENSPQPDTLRFICKFCRVCREITIPPQIGTIIKQQLVRLYRNRKYILDQKSFLYPQTSEYWLVECIGALISDCGQDVFSSADVAEFVAIYAKSAGDYNHYLTLGQLVRQLDMGRGTIVGTLKNLLSNIKQSVQIKVERGLLDVQLAAAISIMASQEGNRELMTATVQFLEDFDIKLIAGTYYTQLYNLLVYILDFTSLGTCRGKYYEYFVQFSRKNTKIAPLLAALE